MEDLKSEIRHLNQIVDLQLVEIERLREQNKLLTRYRERSIIYPLEQQTPSTQPTERDIMQTTITTKNHGEKTFCADKLAGGSYVYLGREQIAENGSTIRCDGTQAGLEKSARRWWKKQLRSIAKYGTE